MQLIDKAQVKIYMNVYLIENHDRIVMIYDTRQIISVFNVQCSI